MVGSLRKGSFTRQIASYVAERMNGTEARFLDISQLPMYNQDLDDAPPQAWVDFRKEVSGMDAYLFATPEYNRSIPPVLKNALDVASRPTGQNAWGGKPGAMISVSPGQLGGFGASAILRQTLAFLNIDIMPQPEVYIRSVHTLLDERGALADARTQRFLDQFAQAFGQWIERA